ncbi:MAG: outer membrane protein assembly factor BamA [Gammaproteobacteria bacterium]|nr:outer membrane protein assembly factor BamA [Gammaproteobacteria bacterium]MDH3560275.1 outer membrane protein assembly factor BamA [Gammaproteobacteria bacterium]
MRTVFHILLLFLLLSGTARAFEPFVVKDVRVEGLQRISAGTVFNYLPVKVGDSIDTDGSAAAIRALFKTGFFNDVYLEQDGDVLVVHVTERAAVSSIEIKGNRDLETEELLNGLKQIGLAEGRVFDRSLLDKVEQELQRQYFSRGKYAVRLDTTVTPLERNRVGILIDIAEGQAARIKQINIVGNQRHTDKELLDDFTLSSPGIFSFITKNDQYSKQKLAADLEILRSFYLDRGHLNFNITSTQVSITPDKKDIYITINISEGEQYSISEVTLSGDLVVEPEELFPLVRINPKDVFSRKRVTEAVERISAKLGDHGYAFANVNTVPELDDENNEVSLAFFIDPGDRVYVRRVNVEGNVATRDEVLRREMRQMEAGWFSAEKVERSRARLQRLGYFEDVNVETPTVPGTTDQVDVNYSVTETSSGSITAGVGYSQSSGLLFNASVSQDNFLGRGKRVSFAFNNSDVNTVYSFSYTNPYYTIDGISRGFGSYYRETDADEANLSDYTTDSFGANISFGIPITEFERIFLNTEYENIELKPTTGSPAEVFDFINQHGDNYDNIKLTGSWSHDTRNKAIFADRGGLMRVAVETTVPGSGLEYYKLNYRQQQFVPLTRNLTLSLNGELGYGEGYGDFEQLPFFENFFAGGVRSVRGFEDNTLGPRDANGNPIGGSFRVVGNAELIFPVPFFEDSKSFRMSAFLDIGNVFDNFGDFDTGELRYSVGLAGLWLSPMGPLSISLGYPINEEPEDELQKFQFTIGTFF